MNPNLSKDQFQTLYHGTTADAAADIDTSGIKANDLGAVYATPDPDRAEMYARTRAKQNGDGPAVVEFRAHADNVKPGARDAESIHWGHVPASAIKSIYHVEYDE